MEEKRIVNTETIFPIYGDFRITLYMYVFCSNKFLASDVLDRRTNTCASSSSSSFYLASVANAPNVLQPYWLIVLPLDVPDLTASVLL